MFFPVGLAVWTEEKRLARREGHVWKARASRLKASQEA